jgi:hypothetical protein
MTPLFWYFPLIVFFGVCDVMIAAREEQTAKYIPQAPHETLEFSFGEKVR